MGGLRIVLVLTLLTASGADASLIQAVRSSNITVPGFEAQEVSNAAFTASHTRFDLLQRSLTENHPEIPEAAIEKAFRYLRSNPVPNMEYVSIIDMDRPSNERRFYLISLETGEVSRYLVAHGDKSGKGAYARQFSNVDGSNQTSLGIYVTSSEYQSAAGVPNTDHEQRMAGFPEIDREGKARALRLRGMENSNSNAESRYIILHGAWYVSDEFVRSGRAGNSEGCPAVDFRYRDEIINRITGGSVMLIYSSRH